MHLGRQFHFGRALTDLDKEIIISQADDTRLRRDQLGNVEFPVIDLVPDDDDKFIDFDMQCAKLQSALLGIIFTNLPNLTRIDLHSDLSFAYLVHGALPSLEYLCIGSPTNYKHQIGRDLPLVLDGYQVLIDAARNLQTLKIVSCILPFTNIFQPE